MQPELRIAVFASKDPTRSPESAVQIRCQPKQRDAGRVKQVADKIDGQLVPCCVDELRPYPSYLADSLEMTSAGLPTFNPTLLKRLEGRPVVRLPEQLRPHRALNEFDWAGVIDELNGAAQRKNQCVPEPILVASNGTVLAGFGPWRLALLEGRQEIHCIEYQLSEDESLQFILAHHRIRRGWNAFVRIRLALTLEPHLQQQALDNMRTGGKYKGLANLPEAQHVDVRGEIAHAAGVGGRNVSKVKTILQTAHPRVIDALGHGTLSIDRALQWCGLAKKQQLEQFTRYIWERKRNKVIRQTIAWPKAVKTSPDPITILDALRRQETRQPGSVAVRVSRRRHTVVLIGEDLRTDLHSQGG